MHISEAIDMHHQAYSGDDNEHHRRNRVDHEAEVEVKLTKRQPCEVERHDGGVGTVGAAVSKEIAECRDIRKHGDDGERRGADQSSRLVRHLHARKSEDNEREQGQKEYEINKTIIHIPIA